MTMHNSATIPITLAPPHRDVVPHSYVVWKKPELCRNCGTLHTHCEVYAKTHLRSQFGMDKYVTNLRPLDSPMYNLPVETLEAKLKELPFCSECSSTVNLSHLPPPPITDPKASENLHKMDVVRNSPQHPDIDYKSPSKSRKPSESRKPQTLDDLLKLL